MEALPLEEAKCGDAAAQYCVGVSYLNGDNGMQANKHTAFTWIRKAAEKGFADAECHLAYMYEAGVGTPGDFKLALDFTRRAVAKGHAHATYNLGVYYENGHGVQKDVGWAKKLYQTAADKGDDDAKRAVERLNSDVHVVTSAAEAGDAEARYRLGLMFRSGTQVVRQDENAAHWWMTKAAEQGHVDANGELGMMFESGVGCKPNPAIAVRYIRHAATMGHAHSNFILGSYYETGTPEFPKDLEAAKRHYKIAGDKGHRDGKKAYDRLLDRRTMEKDFANIDDIGELSFGAESDSLAGGQANDGVLPRGDNSNIAPPAAPAAVENKNAKLIAPVKPTTAAGTPKNATDSKHSPHGRASNATGTERARARAATAEPLIFRRESGEWELCAGALQKLTALKGSVMPVSIVGPPKGGKSFLMSCLAGRTSSLATAAANPPVFAVSHSPKPHTAGVWISFPPPNDLGYAQTNINMLYLDTAGWDNNAEVLTVAMLLSSVVILNSTGAVDQNALDRLTFLTQTMGPVFARARDAARQAGAGPGAAAVAAVGDKAGGTRAAAAKFVMPLLVWAARDFGLEAPAADRDVLELCLDDEDIDNVIVQTAALTTKRTLRSCFPERDCILLPRAPSIVADAQARAAAANNGVAADAASKAFDAKLDGLRNVISKRGIVKLDVAGNRMSGKGFAVFAESLVELLNAKTIPTADALWSRASQHFARDAHDSALCVYDESMSTFSPTECFGTDQLARQHQSALSRALHTFGEQMTTAHQATRAAAQSALEAALKKSFDDRQKSNAVMSDRVCDAAFSAALRQLNVAKRDSSTIMGFSAAASRIATELSRKAVGPASPSALTKFKRLTDEAQELVAFKHQMTDQQQTLQRQQAAVVSDLQRAVTQALWQAESDRKKHEAMFDAQKKQYENQLAQMQASHQAALNMAAAKAANELAAAKSASEKMHASVRAGLEQRIDTLERQLLARVGAGAAGAAGGGHSSAAAAGAGAGPSYLLFRCPKGHELTRYEDSRPPNYYMASVLRCDVCTSSYVLGSCTFYHCDVCRNWDRCLRCARAL